MMVFIGTSLLLYIFLLISIVIYFKVKELVVLNGWRTMFFEMSGIIFSVFGTHALPREAREYQWWEDLELSSFFIVSFLVWEVSKRRRNKIREGDVGVSFAHWCSRAIGLWPHLCFEIKSQRCPNLPVSFSIWINYLLWVNSRPLLFYCH